MERLRVQIPEAEPFERSMVERSVRSTIVKTGVLQLVFGVTIFTERSRHVRPQTLARSPVSAVPAPRGNRNEQPQEKQTA